MSNVLYEDRFYNENVKKSFLEELKEGTQKIYSRMFKVSQVLEHELEKDVYEFNREELRRLLYMYMPKTEASSNSNCQYLHKYIDWCIDEGLKKTLNPLDMVDSQWKRQYANVNVKRFWTDRELDSIIDSRENAQDGVLIALLREGVRGSGNSEITNLNKRSVDFLNNKLHLEDDNGTKRTITVSDKCMKLIKQALAEDSYMKMNGSPDPNTKAVASQLISNEFVVRGALSRNVHFYEQDKSVVHRRLDKISVELSMPNFTPISIYRSGMLAMAKDRILEHGSLTQEDYIEIAIQFGEPESAIYRLRSDFLTDEVVKELYGLS